MSQQKKSNQNITNAQLLFRLKRLAIVRQFKVSTLIAYIGLNLVNKGKVVPVSQGLKIIKKSKLDLKIENNINIPCVNVLDAMIHLVIYKRKLINHFIKHSEYEVWEDEVTGPLFDILEQISKIYKI
jgi:hypothetical protein